MIDVEDKRLPLTDLSEEEQLFRETVADFADQALRPHVSEMDQQGRFRGRR